MTRTHKHYASDQIRFINYLRPSLEHSKSHAYSNLSSQHYKYLFRPIFLCRQQNHVRKTHTSANVGVESHKVVPIPFRASLTKSCRSRCECTLAVAKPPTKMGGLIGRSARLAGPTALPLTLPS